MKRSQAAIEFLSTYTWALVVLFFLFATLIYFGVIDFSKLIPENCVFGVQLQCVDYDFRTDTFGITFRNNFDVPLRINSVVLKANGRSVLLTNPSFSNNGALDRIEVGSTFEISTDLIKVGELIYGSAGPSIGYPTYSDLNLIKGKRQDIVMQISITNADKCDFKGCTGNNYVITGSISTTVH